MKFLKWQQSWDLFSSTLVLFCCHFNFRVLLVWFSSCCFCWFFFNHTNTCKISLAESDIRSDASKVFCHGAFNKWIKSLNSNQITAEAKRRGWWSESLMEGGEHTVTTQSWKLVHSGKKKHRRVYLTSVPMTDVCWPQVLPISWWAWQPCVHSRQTLAAHHKNSTDANSIASTLLFAFKHLKTASEHQIMLLGLDPMGVGRGMPALIQGSTCPEEPSPDVHSAAGLPEIHLTHNTGALSQNSDAHEVIKPLKHLAKRAPVLWEVGSLLCLAGHRHPTWTMHKPQAG